jgi:hypothetical protein
MARHRRHHRARTARTALAPLGLAAAASLGATPLALAAPAAAPAEHRDSPPCRPSADVCVDLGEQEAWLLDDGDVTEGPVPITSGHGRDATPTGTFTVQWKDRDHVSKEQPGGEMPYSVFFDTHGRALHAGSLSRDSAGCVHLDEQDAELFYDALEPGDRVQIVA